MKRAVGKTCEKCMSRGRIVMCAFSEGLCEVCKSLETYGHTPPNKVCDKCSYEEDKCIVCGHDC